MGEAVRHDPRDKITYAIDQIDWLVIQVRIRSYRSLISHDLSSSSGLKRQLILPLDNSGSPNSKHWIDQAIPA